MRCRRILLCNFSITFLTYTLCIVIYCLSVIINYFRFHLPSITERIRSNINLARLNIFRAIMLKDLLFFRGVNSFPKWETEFLLVKLQDPNVPAKDSIHLFEYSSHCIKVRICKELKHYLPLFHWRTISILKVGMIFRMCNLSLIRHQFGIQIFPQWFVDQFLVKLKHKKHNTGTIN